MRPITNFTLHAILAAALTAFAATSAAAGKFDAYLELGSIRGETEVHKDRKGEQLELLSYSFGDAQGESKVDSFTVKQGVKPYKLDRVFVKSWSTSGDAGTSRPPISGGVRVASGDVNDSPVGANEKLTVGSGRTESGQATGKRVHKPLSAQTYYDAGSVTLSGRFPACRVGAAYNSAAIGHGNGRYEMSDVVVTNCATESISLNFAKVKVRGWDPEKKEE